MKDIVYKFGPIVYKSITSISFRDSLYLEGKKLSKSHNKNLASKIEKTFQFTDIPPKISKEIYFHTKKYIKVMRDYKVVQNLRYIFKISNMWINFQNSNEYNPCHYHPNSDISFIIYLKIPNEIYEEEIFDSSRSSPPGSINFFYGEPKINYITHINIIPKECEIMFFPSDLRHEVLAFKSKFQRISVAGNLKLKKY